MSRHLSCALSLFCISILVKCENPKRVKRYLGFPKGTSLATTIALATFLPKDILPEKIPFGFAHIVECDFAYTFPYGVPVKKPTPQPVKMKKRKKVPPENGWYSSQWTPTTFYSQFPEKRKWKLKKRARMLLGNLGSAIDRFGWDGSACTSRLSCEVHQNLSYGTSLVEDLILTLVPPPQPENNCGDSLKACPISILQILIHSTPPEDLLPLTLI